MRDVTEAELHQSGKRLQYLEDRRRGRARAGTDLQDTDLRRGGFEAHDRLVHGVGDDPIEVVRHDAATEDLGKGVHIGVLEDEFGNVNPAGNDLVEASQATRGQVQQRDIRRVALLEAQLELRHLVFDRCERVITNQRRCFDSIVAHGNEPFVLQPLYQRLEIAVVLRQHTEAPLERVDLVRLACVAQHAHVLQLREQPAERKRTQFSLRGTRIVLDRKWIPGHARSHITCNGAHNRCFVGRRREGGAALVDADNAANVGERPVLLDEVQQIAEMTRRRTGPGVRGREPNRSFLIITADRRHHAAFALEHELVLVRTDDVRPPLEMIEADARIRQMLWKPDATAFPPEQTRLGRTDQERLRFQ